MKLLVIGVGGTGSFLIEELCKSIDQGQIDPNIEISIADNDSVEIEQIKYQNFVCDEVGLNKAQALAERFKPFGIAAINKRIKTASQLKGYDFVILCVDNDTTRELVINYAFSRNIDFLDLRADGRRISAFPKMPTREENLKLIDAGDTTCYSCQDPASLRVGRIDKGNRIVAIIGVQMLLNHLRGLNNKIINLNI
ncbi:MAG: ThiF family adenylyltransferase (plasmid) [Candidatus Methanoperedens sp.]|nr:MAG: ThiF family adenylyltransferase [Candidatus Methanoperedens sp.]